MRAGKTSASHLVDPWLIYLMLSSARFDGDGGSYDVHNRVSDDRQHRAQGLETTGLGLWVVVCVRWLFNVPPTTFSFKIIGFKTSGLIKQPQKSEVKTSM